MRRTPVAVLFSLGLLALAATLLLAAPPVIDDVVIDRGRDTDPTDWPSYHERVVVTVSDPDGVADWAGGLGCVIITDPGGEVHYRIICAGTLLTPGESWQVDSDTVACSVERWNLLGPPLPGPYSVEVWDLASLSDSLTTVPTPTVSEDHPVLTAPPPDGVTGDTAPTFAWTAGIPGSTYELGIKEEGMATDAGMPPADIWSVSLGGVTSAVYNFDASAARLSLLPGHSYFWRLVSRYADDVYVSDPRVAIWTLQETRGRFTVYEAYPEPLPNLPGKLAYTCWVYPPPAAWEWADLPVSMIYSPDPWTRTWLGPNYAQRPKLSDDGATAVYWRWWWRSEPSPHFYQTERWWLDPLDGSPRTQIGFPSDVYYCDLSPDGQQIAFTYQEPWPVLDSHLVVADADGSDPTVLVTRGVGWQLRFPRWSRDGQWIAYQDTSLSGDQVPVIRSDGGASYLITPSAVAGHPGVDVTNVIVHDWSPDDARVACTFHALPPGGVQPDDSVKGVGTLSVAGGTLTPVFLTSPAVVCCADAGYAMWSPDGTKIAFTSGHHLPDPPPWQGGVFEPRVEVWAVNADGTGDPVRLTYNYSWEMLYDWSGPNTGVGTDVPVIYGNATVTFGEVTAEGNTTVTVSSTPPAGPPSGFTFLGQYYDISTDAAYAGTITIEIHYDDTGLTLEEEESLALLHWVTDHWQDVTVPPNDTVNNIVRGEVTSLSGFAVALGPRFVGLLPPVNNDGSSVFKLRSTVPVKFRLVAADGSYVSDAVAQLYIAKVCSQVIGTFDEAESPGKADTGNTFRYDAEANQYIFNFGTKGLSTGTWVLQVVVNGMVARQVYISLR